MATLLDKTIFSFASAEQDDLTISFLQIISPVGVSRHRFLESPSLTEIADSNVCKSIVMTGTSNFIEKR